MSISENVTGTLRAQDHGHPPLIFDARGNGGAICPTITGDHNNRITDYTAIVVHPVSQKSDSSNGTKRDYNAGQCVMQKVTGTINPGGHPGSYNWQDAYNDLLVVDDGNCDVISAGIMRGLGPTLNASHEQPILMSDRKCRNGITQDGTATTLTAQEKERPIVGAKTVRRLTPLECERLQGFPDGWTEIGDWTDTKGKNHKEADSPRYKALGNSIALPFWEWLARRIAAQYERPVTIGSLFDGIGGFPLAFTRAGGKAVWASEIEEFPIAVTKHHFGEE